MSAITYCCMWDCFSSSHTFQRGPGRPGDLLHFVLCHIPLYNSNNIYICFAIVSGSGMCDACPLYHVTHSLLVCHLSLHHSLLSHTFQRGLLDQATCPTLCCITFYCVTFQVPLPVWPVAFIALYCPWGARGPGRSSIWLALRFITFYCIIHHNHLACMLSFTFGSLHSVRQFSTLQTGDYPHIVLHFTLLHDIYMLCLFGQFFGLHCIILDYPSVVTEYGTSVVLQHDITLCMKREAFYATDDLKWYRWYR